VLSEQVDVFCGGFEFCIPYTRSLDRFSYLLDVHSFCFSSAIRAGRRLLWRIRVLHTVYSFTRSFFRVVFDQVKVDQGGLELCTPFYVNSFVCCFGCEWSWSFIQVSMTAASLVSSTLCFGCKVNQYRHQSKALGGLEAVFSVITPPDVDVEQSKPTPVVYYLSGLTCTDQNFIQKAGACRAAARLNLIIVAPDTSPRGAGIPGEDDSYDFGTGAGFYLNATEEPYRSHYRMYAYVVEELPEVVRELFPSPTGQRLCSITGHSMGGHGALVCALRNPGKYRSVSAFAPIAHPTACPWGQKAFRGYLGSVEAGRVYDATCLVQDASIVKACNLDDILIDQGTADQFWREGQLRADDFVSAARDAGQKVTLRMQEGYDHSYFFVSTFIDDHLEFHAARLRRL
jgi:S-formylglutathione hydrolase